MVLILAKQIDKQFCEQHQSLEDITWVEGIQINDILDTAIYETLFPIYDFKIEGSRPVFRPTVVSDIFELRRNRWKI